MSELNRQNKGRNADWLGSLAQPGADQAGSGIAGVGYGGAVEVDGLFWVLRSFLVTLCPTYVVRKM